MQIQRSDDSILDFAIPQFYVVVKNLIIATHEHEPIKGEFSDLRNALEIMAEAIKIDSKDAIRTQGRIIAEIMVLMLFKYYRKNCNRALTLDQHLKELKGNMGDSAGRKLHNLLNAIRYSSNTAVHFNGGNAPPPNKADTLYCLSAVFDAVLTLFFILEIPHLPAQQPAKPFEPIVKPAYQIPNQILNNPNPNNPFAKPAPLNPAQNPNNPFAKQAALNPIPAAQHPILNAGPNAQKKHKNHSDTPTKTLYVTGVDASLTDNTLACYFASVDEIESCAIRCKPGRTDRVAFVNFKSIEGAIAARNRFHNAVFPNTATTLHISFRKT